MRVTTCGLDGSESVKVKVPVAVPMLVGVNVRVTVQLAPPAKLPVGQVVAVCANGAATTVRIEVTANVPVLVSVTVIAELTIPKTVSGKVMLCELKRTAP